ncbi:adenylyltransferase/cytidyltransferase family protein [Arthrobacter sp. MDB2-24]
MTIGYVPGGFDMFHVGHLNILKTARTRCDVLMVGVASDESLFSMKGRMPVIPQSERMAIVEGIRFVDVVVLDVSIDKRIAWAATPFDVLFKGDDWLGTAKGAKLEREMAEVGVSVQYFPYTAHTSSTMLRRFIEGIGEVA